LPPTSSFAMKLSAAFLAAVAFAAPQVDYDVAYDQGTGISSYHEGNTHCKSGTKLDATGDWKTFDDGSHHQKIHKTNIKCGWHITAPAGEKIEFRFTRFAVQDPVCPDGADFQLKKKKISFQMQYENLGVDLHYTGGCKGGAAPQCVEGVKFFDTPEIREADPSKPELFFCGDVYLFEYPWKCDIVYDGKTMCSKNHVTDMDGASGTNSRIQASQNFGWNFRDAANGDFTAVQRTGTADPDFKSDAAFCEYKTYKPAPAYDIYQGSESYEYLKENCGYLFHVKESNHYCVEDRTVAADAVVNGKCVWNQAQVQTRPSFHHLNTPGNRNDNQKNHLDWGVFTQKTNSLFVDFETDGTKSDYGWEIAYRSVKCAEGEQCDCTVNCGGEETPEPETPAWANYDTCPHTRCKYTNKDGNTNTKIFHGYAENGALWNANFHCERLDGYGANNCKCVCDESFKCSMTHHHAGGTKTNYNACAEKQMGQRWPPANIKDSEI